MAAFQPGGEQRAGQVLRETDKPAEPCGEVKLQKGDYLHIPAHVKHKVLWTDPDNITLWLCVFYKR